MPDFQESPAKRLKYKKTIAQGFNLYDMIDELYAIEEDCSEIQWCVDGDEDELIEALNGDEEEAFEFRMLFSEIAGEATQLHNLLDSHDNYITECFDTFFVAVANGAISILGWEYEEDDYFSMASYEQDFASSEAAKKLARLTKQEIINAARQCFGVAAAMLNLRYKYDYLKAAIDTVKGKNHAYLEAVKDIEKLYEAAEEEGWEWGGKCVRVFEKAVADMPSRVWVE